MKPGPIKDRDQETSNPGHHRLCFCLYLCIHSFCRSVSSHPTSQSQPVYGPQLPHVQFTRPTCAFPIKFQILRSENLRVICPCLLTVPKDLVTQFKCGSEGVSSWGHREIGYQRKDPPKRSYYQDACSVELATF